MFGRWLKWEMGRQKTGYSKMLLAEFRFPVPFDMYILKYPTGSVIPKHVDTVQKGKHYRLNVILKQPKKGGIFKCSKSIINTKRIKFFRPDIEEHEVTKIEDGKRVVFSFGFIL